MDASAAWKPQELLVAGCGSALRIRAELWAWISARSLPEVGVPFFLLFLFSAEQGVVWDFPCPGAGL